MCPCLYLSPHFFYIKKIIIKETTLGFGAFLFTKEKTIQQSLKLTAGDLEWDGKRWGGGESTVGAPAQEPGPPAPRGCEQRAGSWSAVSPGSGSPKPKLHVPRGAGAARGRGSPAITSHCGVIFAASARMRAMRSWLMRKTNRRLAICRGEGRGGMGLRRPVRLPTPPALPACLPSSPPPRSCC